MAERETCWALMSIQPQYSQQILGGSKTVEFRKRGFGRQVTHVLIYETSPTSAIVGYFVVAGLEQQSPEKLWRTYRKKAGISADAFDAYYQGSSTGVALRVDAVFVLEEPIELATLGVSHPPQSFRYVDAEQMEGLMDGFVARDASSRSARTD